MALPLTIRRAPSKCGMENELLLSPRVEGGPLGRWSNLEIPKATQSLGRSLLAGQRPRATFGTVSCPPAAQKENCVVGIEELSKLLDRKAANPVDPAMSPTKLNNPLSLARFHDAIGLQNPPPEMRNVEVRACHGTVQPKSPERSPKTTALVFRSPEDQVSPRTTVCKDAQPEHRVSYMPPYLMDELAESSRAPLQRRKTAESSPPSRAGPSRTGCPHVKPSKRNTAVHGPVDGAAEVSPKPPNPATREPLADINYNSMILNGGVGSRMTNCHGPVRNNEEPTLEEQTRMVEDRFAKQQRLYADQLLRAERYGHVVDMAAIFGNDIDRVDEMNPKSLGPKDAEAKLREWDADEAERLDQIKGKELAELAARVKEAEEKKSLGLRGEDYALGLAAEESLTRGVEFNVGRWQKTIQANHRELNEGKRGKGRVVKGEGVSEVESVERELLKLDVTMVDAVDSDGTAVGDFSGEDDEGKDEVVGEEKEEK